MLWLTTAAVVGLTRSIQPPSYRYQMLARTPKRAIDDRLPARNAELALG